MGCIGLDQREEEKKRAQTAYEARTAILKESGADKKALERDPVLRQIKAEIRKSSRRINAIAATAAHEAKVKADKVAAAAAPKEKGKDSKKAAPKGKKDEKPAKPKAPKKD
ncbi:MAG: hypothetical protein MUC50_01570 [Myxococcota bacterium]|jgi:hypothetical protein|nr:hypothetical protein [Myxococcota bacterium]